MNESDTITKNKSSTHAFEAETGKLLDIMINSLYTDKEICIRELLSNASDALDKLRYESIQNPDIKKDDSEACIKISLNKEDGIIIISDNGIGMSEDELIENLGTIAKSGTQKFCEALKEQDRNASDLIGKFGVGFYSAFMIADKIEVISRKAGLDETFVWESFGKESFSVKISDKKLDTQGTKIIIHLKSEEMSQFTDEFKIKHCIKTHNNYINFPIYLCKKDAKEQVNSGKPLWLQDKNEITKEQYKECYNSVFHSADEPLITLHNNNEGIIEYINLLFIPSKKPFDLHNSDRKTRVKLYNNRVLINDNEMLIPEHLRFVKGIVECKDLPLNVSRETIQKNSFINQIKNNLEKKILNELCKLMKNDEKKYKEEFWNIFGPTLKEGLCGGSHSHSTEAREKILKACLFNIAHKEDDEISHSMMSLDSYIESHDDCKILYYFVGSNVEDMKRSSQIEGLLVSEHDVILLSDDVDDFWTNATNQYKDLELKSALLFKPNNDSESDDKGEKDTNEQCDMEELAERMQLILKDDVEKVIISKRLVNSPACLGMKENGMSARMENFMQAQGHIEKKSRMILEINPNHKVICSLAAQNKSNSCSDIIRDKSYAIFTIACIAEGCMPNNKNTTAKIIEKIIVNY